MDFDLYKIEGDVIITIVIGYLGENAEQSNPNVMKGFDRITIVKINVN